MAKTIKFVDSNIDNFHTFPAIIPSKHMERTLILLKPEAVQRGLIGKIIKRFEARGFKLVAMKFMVVNVDQSTL